MTKYPALLVLVLLMFGACAFAEVQDAPSDASVTVNGIFTLSVAPSLLDFGYVSANSGSGEKTLGLNVRDNHGVEWSLQMWADDLLNEDGVTTMPLSLMKYTLGQDMDGTEVPEAGTWGSVPTSEGQGLVYRSAASQYVTPGAGIDMKLRVDAVSGAQPMGRYNTTIHFLLTDDSI